MEEWRMKRTIRGALFVALVTGASGAACPDAVGTTFLGSGDGAAEGALTSGTQTIAPMSRFLARANTCAFAPDATEAEGLRVALDIVSLVVSSEHGANCDPDSPPVGFSSGVNQLPAVAPRAFPRASTGALTTCTRIWPMGSTSTRGTPTGCSRPSSGTDRPTPPAAMAAPPTRARTTLAASPA